MPLQKKKSIRTSFLRSCLGLTAAVAVVLSVVCVFYVHKAIDTQSATAMRLIITEKTSRLNDDFDSVENAVFYLANEVLSADCAALSENGQYRADFEQQISSSAQKYAEVLPFVKTAYVCLSPDVFQNPLSVYILRTEAMGISVFSKTDFNIAHISENEPKNARWFFEAKQNGFPAWLGPYQNHNLEHVASTISFTVPLYNADGVFFGVAGMDIEVSRLRQAVDNVGYEAAFGFLVGNTGNLIYHKDFPSGLLASQFFRYEEISRLSNFFADEFVDTGKAYKFRYQKNRFRLILASMKNGMLLALSVPERELFSLQSKLFLRLLLIFSAIIIAGVLLSNHLCNRVLNPVLTLTNTASRIAHGEFAASVDYRSNDELGTLAESIRKIAIELKEYISHIHTLAYKDSMTGVKNKAAYIDTVRLLEKRITEDMADFSVFVFDVNALKKVNDTLGHEAGDALITNAAKIISEVFSDCQIFRTGGDEFVALFESSDKEKIDEKNALFASKIASFNKENPSIEALSVSHGAAAFSKESDRDYSAVFERADKAMYQNKQDYYCAHAERRRT